MAAQILVFLIETPRLLADADIFTRSLTENQLLLIEQVGSVVVNTEPLIKIEVNHS